ncbi:MAG: TIGR03067 domain-containing protein [Isosphaeraceae bacterium]
MTMTTRRAVIGLAVATVLGTGFASRGDDAKKETAGGDLKKLEGKWTTRAGNGETTTYTFKGNKLAIEAPSRSYEMTVTLNEKAKPEKAIDFKIVEAPDDAKGKTSRGIYKFDGADKFIFCFRGEGDRPDKYEQIGFEQIVVELKREKGKD